MDALTTQLISQKAICSKYDEMLNKMYADPPENLRKFIEENAELFAYVRKHTGAVSELGICPRGKGCVRNSNSIQCESIERIKSNSIQ